MHYHFLRLWLLPKYFACKSSMSLFIMVLSTTSHLRAGLPNERPRGQMWPPDPFYAAPGPSSRNCAGRENYYFHLLIKHLYIYITPNQCMCLVLHDRRLCTRYYDMEFKTYAQSSGPTKSYIYYIQCLHVIGNSFRTSLTGH